MSKLKVLIVDDEPDFLELMALRISSWGYEVLKASEGKNAVAIVKENRPDILVLDYMMPEMDGIATLKEIRKLDKKLPVIMFTAYPNTKTIEDSDSLGIHAFIPKLSAYSEVVLALKSTIEMIEKRLK
ncbi:MAG: response regulator [Candidatus Omnitrophica bacterium]|nr:response regulator [Candidatus Omnitrophota bacterium]